MDDCTVLIVFSDSSLGGTSRSALVAASCWRQAGCSVAFLPLRPIHPDRIGEFEGLGHCYDLGDMPHVAPPAMIHFHHGAWSRNALMAARSFVSCARAANWGSPLLSNNVFSTDDGPLRMWPWYRATGVLGAWALWQYRMGRLPGSRPNDIVILPNAQRDDFFRRPSAGERERARKTNGIAEDERILLRIGSPIMSKWSHDYVGLARSLRPGERLVLVGAPAELEHLLSDFDNVTILPMVSDDEKLRDYYWLADIMVHSADRGETFGNVITEALLCGVPVAYHARVFRDNTPWEFQNIRGFRYLLTARGWRRTILEGNLAPVDRHLVVSRFGTVAVARALGCVLRRTQGSVCEESVDISRLSFGSVILIAVRHNPLSTSLKMLRLRLRSPRGAVRR